MSRWPSKATPGSVCSEMGDRISMAIVRDSLLVEIYFLFDENILFYFSQSEIN